MKKIVIIGGGLTGLTLAHSLHKANHEVVLLESSHQLGGRFRGEPATLNFILPSEAALSTLHWLKAISPTTVAWSEADLQPLVFESHAWRPFLGFGDFAAATVDELSCYSQSEQWLLTPGFDQLTRALIEQLPFEARLRSEVTGFIMKDGRVSAAVANAAENVSGDCFVFCPSAEHLNKLLPADVLKPASRSRLAKQAAWTAVTFGLKHTQPLDTSSALRFVLGSGKEFEPVIGRAWPEHSVWLNLVAGDRDDDLEHIGDCVRFIKRTLRRVWPELLEGHPDENIRVRPHTYGRLDLKLKDYAFPELPNLLLADARLSGLRGELAAAAMGQEIAALFVAQPQTLVLSDSQLTEFT